VEREAVSALYQGDERYTLGDLGCGRWAYISLNKERQIEYFKNWDGLDVYALGEGDFLATEIINRFLDAGKSIPKLAKNGIPSSIFSLNGQIVHQEVQKKGNELAKFPPRG
jgi:hypothetical protein